MNKIISLIVVLMLLVVTVPTAHATDVNISWGWPTEYCTGDPLPASHLQSAEIYISETTIPRVVSDCFGAPDIPPTGAIIANVPVSATSTVIDLQCGKTYFLVIRVQVLSGGWSNFSGEATKTVDCGRPGIPITVVLT